MKNLKASYYNFLYEYPKHGKALLYNSLSNSCLLLHSISEIKSAKVALASPNDSSTEYHEALFHQRFIVSADCDERELIRDRYYAGQKQKDIMNITIACTIQCNFRCTYCFEPHRNQYLSDEHFSALKDVIVAQAKEYKKIQITWFGGEPLLMAKKIEEWSQILIHELSRFNTLYFATIVTNGSLLNKKNIEILKNSQIKGIQVTIDGPEFIHDRSRPSVGGKGTYRKIVNNLEKYADQLIDLGLTIRVNVDRSNIDQMENLLSDLSRRGINKFASIYFARVENSTEYCGDISSQCFSSKEFSSELNQLNELKLAYGFAGESLPKNVYAFCGAVSKGSFVIDAAGDLFKCWHDVGNPEKRYSTIFDQKKEIFQLGEYTGFSHFEDDDCLNCKVLPLCQGNCPYYRIKENPQKQCTPLKFNLQNHLEKVYHEQLNS